MWSQFSLNMWALVWLHVLFEWLILCVCFIAANDVVSAQNCFSLLEAVGQRYTAAALLPGKKPSTPCVGGRVGPRSGLDRCGKFVPVGIRYPDHPAYRELLYWLHYPSSQRCEFCGKLLCKGSTFLISLDEITFRYLLWNCVTFWE